MHEREAMAILVSATGDQYVRRAAALAAAGSALSVLEDPYAFRKQLSEPLVQAVRLAIADRERILEKIARMGVHLLLRDDAGYPGLLLQIPRPPHLLYVQGERDLRAELPIAVVGMRRVDDYGARHTFAIARDLASEGACIVSGLAIGVDAMAHEGALAAHGRTIAVLGGGLDRFYPQENENLRDRILDTGGSVVTEYPMGARAEGFHFLLRNRIIAGMSRGVVVTRGLYRSGASRTASDAADYGREVFALPGSVEEAESQLTHRLIAEGAHLAGCAPDVLNVLFPGCISMRAARDRKKAAEAAIPAPRGAKQSAGQKKAGGIRPPVYKPIPEDLPEEERCVLVALSGGEMEFDALCEKTGVDATALGAALISLEMDGLIESPGALRYVRSV